MKLFFYVDEEGKVWLRGQRKVGTTLKKASCDDRDDWVKADVQLLPRVIDVAWSENEECIEGERTWLLENVSICMVQTTGNKQFSNSAWCFSECFANLLNGLTPDG